MKQIEQQHQIAWVLWFSLQYPTLAPLLHHSPNGGKRNAREAARFKAMGTRAGFPDLFLAVPSNVYHGLFVELKTDKGRLTDNQKAYGELLSGQGYRVEVVRSFDEFKTIINEYLYRKL